jgi:hypothetical protein
MRISPLGALALAQNLGLVSVYGTAMTTPPSVLFIPAFPHGLGEGHAACRIIFFVEYFF